MAKWREACLLLSLGFSGIQTIIILTILVFIVCVCVCVCDIGTKGVIGSRLICAAPLSDSRNERRRMSKINIGMALQLISVCVSWFQDALHCMMGKGTFMLIIAWLGSMIGMNEAKGANKASNGNWMMKGLIRLWCKRDLDIYEIKYLLPASSTSLNARMCFLM